MLKEFFIEVIADQIKECTKCNLSKSRMNASPGDGPFDADLFLCGEGNGAEEDRTGKVFVGPAGNLLTKYLKYIDIDRKNVFISNVVHCRPPGNRNPSLEEVACCIPYVEEQIKVINPKVLLLLGSVALKSLFKDQSIGIMRQRGRWQDYNGIPTMATFHPAFLLRQTDERFKDQVKEDLKKVKSKLGEDL